MNIAFKSDELLRIAFTDSSWCQGDRRHIESNQRFEFFGDVVISVMVSEYLIRRFPYKREGDLTNLRSALTRETALADLAEELGMEPCIDWQRSESILERRRVLADTFEAFIGALALDQGYNACRAFLRRVMLPRVQGLRNAGNLVSPKNKLQTRANRKDRVNPKYRIVERIKSDHNEEFVVEVSIVGEVIGQGRAFSKKEAEEEAAREALKTYVL
ncbi:MAG: ribonuclease III [bacterium]|nr:ribonuclease III [bacterium]